MSETTAVRSTRVLVDGRLRPAGILMGAGSITGVVGYQETPRGVDDLGDLVVMPALVDSHVHVNEPGRTEWEGFATATAAALAGGVAVIADMPLNSIPPTTTAGHLAIKRAAAAAGAAVDVAFWGGAVPGNLDEIPALAAAGVFGFKAFLVDSGVDEFGCIGLDDLDAVLAATAATGRPLLVHAEAPGPIAAAAPCGTTYRSYLDSRPAAAEVEAIAAVIAAVRRTGGAAHILHLSAADALPDLAAARAEGLPITVETCPHYLVLCAEEIGDDDVAAKCAPPIRERANRERLWEGLAAGIIDMVVSDHSPCPAESKQGGFAGAWGGIASLELRLPLMWTGASRRGFGLEDLRQWLCAAPAALLGLPTGSIAPGMRADLVAWDPDGTITVDPGRLVQRHPVTPYAGRSLRGRVMRTIVRGGSTPRLLEAS